MPEDKNNNPDKVPPSESEGKITIGWEDGKGKNEDSEEDETLGFPSSKEAPSVPKETFYKGEEAPQIPRWKGVSYFILDVALNAAIIVGLVFLIRANLISPFQVSGPSMCDTLNKIDGECVKSYGEYIIVNKFVYRDFWGYRYSEPQRGDIVVFEPPHKEKEFFIKRIIGLPGEKIKLNHGYVEIFNDEYPEGMRLEENYLNSKNIGNTRSDARGYSEFLVPEGHYFVLGDNRSSSNDSRRCFRENSCSDEEATPYLKWENIEGKAWFVLLPLENIRLLSDDI